MKAVLLISHGSRSHKTIDEVSELVAELKLRSGIKIFHYAFLEIAAPSIPEGIDACVHDGVTEIVIMLNFLNAGRHVNDDIPAIVDEARQKYPHVNMRITEPVGQHPRIKELFLEML